MAPDTKISVIVPIYNANDYIVQCIDSILKQSWKEFELILIDDGSTDGSGETIDRMAKKDSRIRVIHKPNEGLVMARKTGIENAVGDFICWVDSDDWVEETFLEDFIRIMNETKTDAVFMALYQDIDANSTLIRNGLDDGVYSVDEILDRALYNGKFFEYGLCPPLVTKMFRRELLIKTQLTVDEEIVIGEDAAVTYTSLMYCNKIAVCNKANYHYVQHADSITKKSDNLEIDRINKLIDYIRVQSEKAGKYQYFIKQLMPYKNYLLCLRQIGVFDNNDSILNPYGGIEGDSNIVIYGAGVLGQRIYAYVKQFNQLHVVGWLDRNYEKYRKDGFEVDAPERLINLKDQFEYIILANITYNAAMNIKKELINVYDVKEEQVRWFTDEFQNGEITDA